MTLYDLQGEPLDACATGGIREKSQGEAARGYICRRAEKTKGGPKGGRGGQFAALPGPELNANREAGPRFQSTRLLH